MNTTKIAILATALLVPFGFSQQCPFKDAKGNSVCATATPTCTAAVKVEAVEATINTDALAALIRAKTTLMILDARTGKYDDGRRIPGAKSLAASADDATITATAGDKASLIVTYCANLKCPASKALATRLRTLGYTNVLEYPDGIEGWATAGKTIAKAE